MDARDRCEQAGGEQRSSQRSLTSSDPRRSGRANENAHRRRRGVPEHPSRLRQARDAGHSAPSHAPRTFGHVVSPFQSLLLCLQHRAALVPCYAFGTTDLYDISPTQHEINSKGFLWKLNKNLGVAIPLYKGSLGFMPKRVTVDLVFDEPFEPQCQVRSSRRAPLLTCVREAEACAAGFRLRCATWRQVEGKPTEAEVEAAHAEYTRRLVKLFDAHKALLGYADRKLVVS